jgi:hypothetical protein
MYNPAWEGWYQLEGESMGEWIQHKCCVHMYVNGKMIPVETIPEMGCEG